MTATHTAPKKRGMKRQSVQSPTPEMLRLDAIYAFLGVGETTFRKVFLPRLTCYEIDGLIYYSQLEATQLIKQHSSYKPQY